LSSNPAYDGRGNMTSAGGVTYAYTSENMLKSASGATNATLYYDPMGRLSEYDTTVSTRFVYDGPNLIAEIDGASGAILRRYVHGPSDDEPLVWYEGSGTSDRRWLHADERGSIIAITDASGATIAINSYDAWGIPANTNLGRFQYTGQTWFPEIGLYNFKARFYSSTMGRFLQTDPIGYDDGLDWQAYAHNDPVNGRDPTGLDCDSCDELPPIVVNADKPSSGSGSGTTVDVSGLVKSVANAIGSAVKSIWCGIFGCHHKKVAPQKPPIGDSSPQNGQGASQLASAALPPGSYSRPATGPNPLDPQFLNNPITPYELTRINNTINLLVNGDTSQVLSTLNPHYYGNVPDPNTGARLPYDSRGYTAIDVLDSGRGGDKRILFSNTPPSRTYYTNTHYESFYWIGH
jgi:RHS repeat-associated protein